MLEVSVQCPAGAVEPDGAVTRAQGCHWQRALRDEVVGIYVLVHDGEHEESELGYRHLAWQGGREGGRAAREGRSKGIIDGKERSSWPALACTESVR